MAHFADRTFIAVAGVALAGAVRLRPASRLASELFPFTVVSDEDSVSVSSARASHNWRYRDEVEVVQSDDAPDDPDHYKQEQDNWAKHWAPLQPPQWHHPLVQPTAKEFEDLEVLVEDYNKYWRGLPKITEVSPILREAERNPYLFLSNWSSTWWPVPGENMTGTVLFACHHKTGVMLKTNIEDRMRKKRRIYENYEPVGMGEDPWPVGLRTVHMVRDPVDLIISAYRYHQDRWAAEVWNWGHNKLQDPPCFECFDEDHKAIFDTCHFNCTYFELLNRLGDDEDGVAVEAMNSRFVINSMAMFLAFQKDNPETLHVSIDLFKADYLKTAQCMAKFLGLDGDSTMAGKFVEAAKEIDDPSHVTHGQFDNRRARAYLENHPVWSSEFKLIRDMMKEVFRNQAARFGCPEAEAA